MRTFTIILIVVTIIVAGAAIYLFTTIPQTAEPIRFPLSPQHQALLARVPDSAESFALVPTAAVVYAKLVANPVTRDTVEQWTEKQPLPRAWMLGAADIVVWRSGKVTSYAITLDPFRAWLVRIFAGASGEWDGHTLILGGAARTAGAPPAIDMHLPEGDVLVVQRTNARGAFPPIGRPAYTSIRITANEIVVTSRANSDDLVTPKEIRGRFPRHAMLAVTFADPPRILGDMNRLLGTDISSLVAGGGSIALYDVDTGTLLPRPKGVISLPANEESRAATKRLGQVAEIIGDMRDTGSELQVSFDRTSLTQYSTDTFVPATWPATRWQLRMNPATLVPVLRELGDNRGLRFASPRIYRAARDLRKWIDALEQAESVEAADSVAGGVEELRVRVASK